MSESKQTLDIRNNTAENRFEATIEGKFAVVEYSIDADVITFTHTGVPQELEGQGIASQLTKAALTFAQQQKYKIVPRCPFTAAYIKRHPEYQS